MMMISPVSITETETDTLGIVSELQKSHYSTGITAPGMRGKSVDFVNLSITRIAPKRQYLSCTVL